MKTPRNLCSINAATALPRVRRIGPLSGALLVAAATLICGRITLAHDFWIEPTSFSLAPAQPLILTLREGQHFDGDRIPYNPDWYRDFTVVQATGSEPVNSLFGDDPAAILEIDDDQVMIGYFSNRNLAELDREKFDRYVEEEGLEFIEDALTEIDTDGYVPEFFVRCAKLFLARPGSTGSLFNYAFGYPLEIIPQSDPRLVKPGEPLRVQVFYRNAPANELLVQALSKSAPLDVIRVRTDTDGFAELDLPYADTWMLKVVQIQPIVGSPQAKLQSFWATYVFRSEAAASDAP